MAFVSMRMTIVTVLLLTGYNAMNVICGFTVHV